MTAGITELETAETWWLSAHIACVCGSGGGKLASFNPQYGNQRNSYDWNLNLD